MPLTARSLQLWAAFHSGVPYHPSGTGESNELPSPLLHSRAEQISNPWQGYERNNIDHDGGRCPVRALLFRDRLCSCVMLAHDGGRVPVRLLLFRSRLSRCVMLAHDGGRVPMRLLLFRSRLCSCVMLALLFCASEDAMQVDCRPLIEGGAAERRNQMRWYYLAARSH